MKVRLDEWAQRSNEVGVWVSNIKTKDFSNQSRTYTLVSSIGRGPEWLLRIHKSPR